MWFSFVVELGPCGFGLERGLIPALKLGVIRIGWLGVGSFAEAARPRAPARLRVVPPASETIAP